MPSLIAVLDVGSTKIKAMLYDLEGNMQKWASLPLSTTFSMDGQVEQDPQEIWQKSLQVLREVTSGSMDEILCLGLTNQRATSLIWDRKTGLPLSSAITWQDLRTKEFSKKKDSKAGLPFLRKVAKTLVFLLDGWKIPRGIPLWEMIRIGTHFSFRPALSAIHLAWNLEHLPSGCERENICFGTVDTWVIWNLTGGRVHATDLTNASMTGLFQLFENRWNSLFLKLLSIPSSVLPEVLPSAHIYGETEASLLGKPLLLSGVIADQQASLVGLHCLQKGKLKCTIGTGAFLDLSVGERPLGSLQGVLPLAGLGMKEKNFYLLEGMINGGGNVLDWWLENIKISCTPSEAQEMALSVDNSDGVYLVPAFSGLFAPYWNTSARALLTGLKKTTTKAHLTRAIFESIGYQALDAYFSLVKESGLVPQEIWVDGGVAQSDLVLQWISNMLEIPVIRPSNCMATSLGACYVAGMGKGIWNERELPAPSVGKIFHPKLSPGERKGFYDGWKEAVRQSQS